MSVARGHRKLLLTPSAHSRTYAKAVSECGPAALNWLAKKIASEKKNKKKKAAPCTTRGKPSRCMRRRRRRGPIARLDSARRCKDTSKQAAADRASFRRHWASRRAVQATKSSSCNPFSPLKLTRATASAARQQKAPCTGKASHSSPPRAPSCCPNHHDNYIYEQPKTTARRRKNAPRKRKSSN